MGRDYPNDSIVENGQNPETSPGDVRRLAVTQTPVKNHQLTLMWKNSKGVNNNNRNLTKEINGWDVPPVEYSGSFLKWTREELKQMDKKKKKTTKKKTMKLMIMHRALHPRDDVDRLYVSRKEGGRGLASTEDSVDVSIQRLEDYIEKHDGGLITDIKNDTDNTMTNRMTITRKQKWEEKQLFERFKRLYRTRRPGHG